MNRFADIGQALRAFQPGDTVTFGLERNTNQLHSSGRLRHDAGRLLDRAVFLDGRSGKLSHRRTGFSDVLMHDVAIPPGQIGSPLVNFAGQLIGVNIARCSRESVLAIPLRAVNRLYRSQGPKSPSKQHAGN